MARHQRSIAAFMGLIAAIALGVAGLKQATELWAAGWFTATVVLLLGAIVNAIVACGPQRATWLGFLIFGGAYFVWSFGRLSGAALEPPSLATTVALEALHERIHPELPYIAPPMVPVGPPTPPMVPAGPPTPPTVPVDPSPPPMVSVDPSPPPTISYGPPQGSPPTFLSGNIIVGNSPWAVDEVSYSRVGESLWTLVFGAVGAVWARLAYRARERRALNLMFIPY